MTDKRDTVHGHEEIRSATAQTGVTSQRFVASHLLSIHSDRAQRLESADLFSEALHKNLVPNVAILRTSAPASEHTERRVVIFDADPRDVAAMRGSLTSDTVIEPLLERHLDVASLPFASGQNDALSQFAAAQTTAQDTDIGVGAQIVLNLKDAGGQSIGRAKVTVTFTNLQQPANILSVIAVSDNAGQVSIAFDPKRWLAQVALVEPADSYWTAVAMMPTSGQVITLQPLPSTGPTGWWQKSSNVAAYDPQSGQGIKIGVIDTGVGPHPYLDHAVPIGAFLDGNFYPGAEQGRDVRNHGTHVSGIIGARPLAADGAFGGIAAGAEVFVARIFSATSGGNQGDVANAIDALVGEHGVDIINLSFSGAASVIEHDAVISAFQRGVVCICSAGNGFGSPIAYPGAYPESVAVSGLGLTDCAPVGTMPASFVPVRPDHFGSDGMYLASFSNLGPQLACSAAGNGIISTVPTTPQAAAPYVDMSGTSMSAPLTAGALANILARDPSFAAMPRDAARATHAKQLLVKYTMSVNLNPLYQGNGMTRVS